MLSPAQFQEMFGAALDGQSTGADPALDRALAVHRNTSARAAIDALSDSFPVVRQLIGDEAFFGVAAAFYEAHPPSDPRLCVYGYEFPEFLQTFPPLAELPYLPDVAALEQIVIQALFAPDAPTAPPDAFARTLDLDRPLALHPAARVMASAYPAASLWRAHRETPVDLSAIVWQPEHALVTRPADSVRVTVLDPTAYAFAAACAAGRPLGQAAAAAGDGLPQAFAQLINAGAFRAA